MGFFETWSSFWNTKFCEQLRSGSFLVRTRSDKGVPESPALPSSRYAGGNHEDRTIWQQVKHLPARGISTSSRTQARLASRDHVLVIFRLPSSFAAISVFFRGHSSQPCRGGAKEKERGCGFFLSVRRSVRVSFGAQWLTGWLAGTHHVHDVHTLGDLQGLPDIN